MGNMWNTIQANEAQIEKLTEKHLSVRPFGVGFRWDSTTKTATISLSTFSGCTVEFEMRNNEPCFVKFSGPWEDTRYAVANPTGEMYKKLKKIGDLETTKFMTGQNI